MQEEPPLADHDLVIAAARQDAGREGARLVHLTVGQLWRLIHRAPTLKPEERDELAAGLRAR